jgi:hypothetical protein
LVFLRRDGAPARAFRRDESEFPTSIIGIGRRRSPTKPLILQCTKSWYDCLPALRRASSVSTSRDFAGELPGVTVSAPTVSSPSAYHHRTFALVENATPEAVSGLNIAATRLMPGAIAVSNSSHFPIIAISASAKPVIFPPRRSKPATNPEPTGSETATNTMGDCLCLSLERCGNWSRVCDNRIRLQINQLFREHPHSISVSGRPPNIQTQVAIGPTQVRERGCETGKPGFWLRIAFIKRHQYADPPHAVGLLRACHDRPAVAPASSATNSRRLIRSPRRQARATWAGD